MTLENYCREMAQRAKTASRLLAIAPPVLKDNFLTALSQSIIGRQSEIIAANDKDLAAAPTLGLSPAQIDRLRLTPGRTEAMAQGVRLIAQLPEPIGRVLSSTVRPNGLRVDKLSVPLGVIFFIYESRPNVTVDAAALAVKSGNAIILRGGKEAAQSNAGLYRLIADALVQAVLPVDAVQLVSTSDREAVRHLLKLSQYIDLAIPRGGKSLVERVAAEAAMPVMKHFQGICRVYVDRSADLEKARAIIVNAKCQRPGVCNAAECLLIHADVAAAFLPSAAAELHSRGVELRGCTETCRLVPFARPATEQDYATEYLDLILNVKVVASLEAALDHIARFGSGHTEAIITNELAAARGFTQVADAAAVMINASTRFHDGFEFGLGAEIGISTDKFHARGPCGLNELTTYKYVVYGDGQVRG